MFYQEHEPGHFHAEYQGQRDSLEVRRPSERMRSGTAPALGFRPIVYTKSSENGV